MNMNVNGRGVRLVRNGIAAEFSASSFAALISPQKLRGDKHVEQEFKTGQFWSALYGLKNRMRA
ncbi:hypothetical protein [Brucella pseudogrignonensis]|uniref:hypothetical protein n=1 Tax=Brucella pseudogrignonensis TaxID=419475 RepID=UPI003D96358A